MVIFFLDWVLSAKIFSSVQNKFYFILIYNFHLYLYKPLMIEI